MGWFEKNMEYFKFYGRDMETLLSKIKIAHSRRVFCKPDKKKYITIEDLNNGFDKFLKNRSELTSMIKPNNIKASLINKIKSHQNKGKKEKSQNKDNITSFTKDFNENLNYLENIIKSRK